MSDLVPCAECGVRYDLADDVFCPRCGSTARGPPVPAALDVARRRDPGRRRVQASGVLLLAVGVLFLVSSIISLAVPVGEMARTFEDPMADQAGGTLVLEPLDDAPYDVSVHAFDGTLLANATNQTGPFTYASADHATLRYEAHAGNVTTNGTAIVFPSDTLRIPLDGQQADAPSISSTLHKTVVVGRYVFLGLAAVLVAGGAAGAWLRLYGLAATAAVVGAVLALLVLAGYLLAGLLFAVPFGFAAYFILRGRRHFTH